MSRNKNKKIYFMKIWIIKVIKVGRPFWCFSDEKRLNYDVLHLTSLLTYDTLHSFYWQNSLTLTLDFSDKRYVFIIDIPNETFQFILFKFWIKYIYSATVCKKFKENVSKLFYDKTKIILKIDNLALQRKISLFIFILYVCFTFVLNGLLFHIKNFFEVLVS